MASLKKHILSILLIGFVIGSIGCKKCVTCRGICYYCNNFADTLCKSDFANTSFVDTIVQENIRQGHSCIQTLSSKSIDACGSNTERAGVKNLLEPLGYDCR